MEPVRTCLGCRLRADRSSLLRIVLERVGNNEGVAVADSTATLPGRGAWVHPTPACVEKSIARKAIGRALRFQGRLDTTQLMQVIQTVGAETSAPG